MALLLLLRGCLENGKDVVPMRPEGERQHFPSPSTLVELEEQAAASEPDSVPVDDKSREAAEEPSSALSGRLLPPPGAHLLPGIQVGALPLRLASPASEHSRARALEQLRSTSQLADAEGRFHLTGLDPEQPYVLRAMSEEFGCFRSRTYRCGQFAELRLGHLQGLELFLEDSSERVPPERMTAGLSLARTTEANLKFLCSPEANLLLRWLDPRTEQASAFYLISLGKNQQAPPLNWILHSPWFGSVTQTEVCLGPRVHHQFPRRVSTHEVHPGVGLLSVESAPGWNDSVPEDLALSGRFTLIDQTTGNRLQLHVREGSPQPLPEGRYSLSFGATGLPGPWALSSNPITIEHGLVTTVTVDLPSGLKNENRDTRFGIPTLQSEYR